MDCLQVRGQAVAIDLGVIERAEVVVDALPIAVQLHKLSLAI